MKITNKKGSESTIMSYVVIMGLVLAIIGFVLIIVFVVRVGSSSNSQLPAYARDISNIMENTVSTTSDVSVVYKFSDFLKVTYLNEKVTVSREKKSASNSVLLPDDINIEILDEEHETEFLLIQKKGKTITLAALGPFKDKSGWRQARNVTQDCGTETKAFSVETQIAELRNLPNEYPKTGDTTSLLFKTDTFGLDESEVIVYYDPSLFDTEYLCRFDKELRQELKVKPVFVSTQYEQILESNAAVFAFSSFPFVEAKMISLLDDVVGGES